MAEDALRKIGQRWKEMGFGPFADESTPGIRSATKQAYAEKDAMLKKRHNPKKWLSSSSDVPSGQILLDVALERLDRPRRTGPSWTARCPAHDDKSPSLRISESDRVPGMAIFYCHAGCSHESVKNALLSIRPETVEFKP